MRSKADRAASPGGYRVMNPGTFAGEQLRQLAVHGFIESADELGDRRDRWWRARHESTRWEPAELSGEALESALAMSQAVISTHAQLMQAAHDQFRNLSVEWQKASTASDFTLTLSAEAARALNKKITALLFEAMQAAPAHGERRDRSTRQFTVMLHAFPHPGFGEVTGHRS